MLVYLFTALQIIKHSLHVKHCKDLKKYDKQWVTLESCQMVKDRLRKGVLSQLRRTQEWWQILAELLQLSEERDWEVSEKEAGTA